MKITYLIGAGASALRMPVVSNMTRAIERIHKLLNHRDFILDDGYFPPGSKTKKETKKAFQAELISDLEWLGKESQKHASVDTYAKKLTARGNYRGLERLKNVLSAYFMLEQTDQGVDPRYDSFIASLIKTDGDLPENVNILSWNYDSQFEMAFADFMDLHDLETVRLQLNMKVKKLPKRRTKGFTIFKLNGTCGYHGPQGWDSFGYRGDWNKPIDKASIEQIIFQHSESTYGRDMRSSLSFAWEDEGHNERLIDLIVNDVDMTEVLVVIGYSFPFFNREIDRTIITGMRRLKKIYYQDSNANSLTSRIQAVRNNLEGIEIVPITDVEQFFLPYEL